MSYQNQIDEESHPKHVSIEMKHEQVQVVPKPLNFEQIQKKKLRIGFIRKVFGILAIQLFTTALIIYAMTANTRISIWANDYNWITYILFLFILALEIIVFIKPTLMNQVPINYIVLSIFTVLLALILGFVAVLTSPSIVLMAGIMTLTMTLACVLYVFIINDDIGWKGVLFTLFGTGIGLIVIFICIGGYTIISVILGGLMAMVYGAYIICDAFIIMGSEKDGLFVSCDDYILAAMLIYIHIIIMFLYILIYAGLAALGGGRS